MSRLSRSELVLRRQVAARKDLTRLEQAEALGLTRSTWSHEIGRRGFTKRSRGSADYSRACSAWLYAVTSRVSNGKRRPVLVLHAPAVEALGARVGERVRVRAVGRRLMLERERERER